jgi:hypothetical protein
MGLADFDLLNGPLSILFVIISISVGLKIASRYFERKSRSFLLIGFSWVGLSAPWFPSTTSFILHFLQVEVPDQILFLIANVPISIALIFWVVAFTDFKYKEKQKNILVLVFIYEIVYNVLFFWLLFTDPTQIGEVTGITDTNYKLLVNVNMILSLVVLLITGTIFARDSVKSDNQEVSLKGKFLFAAFYTFVIGAILDVFSAYSIFLLIIGRILLIISAFEFYVGFILPNFLKSAIFQ